MRPAPGKAECNSGALVQRQAFQGPIERQPKIILRRMRLWLQFMPGLVTGPPSRRAPLECLAHAPGHAEQPGAEHVRRSQKPELCPRGEEHLLRQLIGISLVSADPTKEIAKRLLVPVHQT